MEQLPVVTVSTLRAYVEEALGRLGCPASSLPVLTEAFLYADLRGAHTHGVYQLYNYINLIRAGRLHLDGVTEVVYQTPSTATLEAHGNPGSLCGYQAMRLAIGKARAVGVGTVAVRNSTNPGVASFISNLALEHGMVGIFMSNTEPLLAPIHSTARMLGANPLAVSIPAHWNKPLIFDFSTSPLSREELERMSVDGVQPEAGLLQDALGHPSRDPATVRRGGALKPLGGTPQSGGHKGFCISALIDIFSALFAGASFGPYVPSTLAFFPDPEPKHQKVHGRGVGHMVSAIRIDAFRPASEFRQAIDAWIDTFQQAPGVDGTPGVLIPGERERQLQQVREKMGIPLDGYIIRTLRRISRALDMPEIEVQEPQKEENKTGTDPTNEEVRA